MNPPNNQAGAAATIASNIDLGIIGCEVSILGSDPKCIKNISFRTGKAHGQHHQINFDFLLRSRNRFKMVEDAIGLIVNGYAKEVLNKLPMEFAVEAQKLLAISLEGSVG